ncbi:Hypothetical protein SCF082_LOCUS40028 [Durusdinium trenchii]|uniref:Uncharacterized protein n=1 Tax=Durusdinium trenchii TaxID=1381693 RepID=A0ABP0Q822_9DINO
MPAWKELLGKTLSPSCDPKVKLHFKERRDCDVHDPMFLRCLTVFARSRGCKIVNAQIPMGQKQDFSVVMCHNDMRDLDTVPAPSMGKKQGQAKKKKKGTPKTATLYKCWTCES